MRSRSRRSVINISFTSCRQTQARINAWIISAAFCAIPAGLKGRAVRKGACYLNACCQSSHVFLLIILVHGDLPTDTCSHTSSLGAHGLFRDDGILVSFIRLPRMHSTHGGLEHDTHIPRPTAGVGPDVYMPPAAINAPPASLTWRYRYRRGRAGNANLNQPKTCDNSPPIKKLKEEPPTKAPVAVHTCAPSFS